MNCYYSITYLDVSTTKEKLKEIFIFIDWTSFQISQHCDKSTLCLKTWNYSHVWRLTSELFGWWCILWMGRIKKLELNICGGIDTPKPGFRDCQTKMKRFPFYYLLGQENTVFYSWQNQFFRWYTWYSKIGFLVPILPLLDSIFAFSQFLRKRTV